MGPVIFTNATICINLKLKHGWLSVQLFPVAAGHMGQSKIPVLTVLVMHCNISLCTDTQFEIIWV